MQQQTTSDNTIIRPGIANAKGVRLAVLPIALQGYQQKGRGLGTAIALFVVVLAGLLCSERRANAQTDWDSPWLRRADTTRINALPTSASKPRARARAFVAERAYPNAGLPAGARAQAILRLESSTGANSPAAWNAATQPTWEPVGPFTVGGRVRAIAMHPTDSLTAVIGAAAGGIWRTVDGGEHWRALFDQGPAAAFGAIAYDPNNGAILYAASGEQSANVDAYLGAGLFKSIDGGDTWMSIGLHDVGAFSRIVVHPNHSNLVFATATKNRPGLYRSTDAGATWSRLFTGPVSDIALSSTAPHEIFVGVRAKGVFYSADTGATWASRSAGLPVSMYRISVARAPGQPDVLLCLLEEQREGGLAQIYRSTNSGVNWSVTHQGDPGFFRGQGWYNQYIVFHPTDPNIALAGGIDIYRTLDGGVSWERITDGATVHVDQHFAAFSPVRSSMAFAANDGGVYRSDDSGASWRSVNNGLALTQFFTVAVDQSSDSTIYGGSQDNGTLSNRNSGAWQKIEDGDGHFVVVDHQNPMIVYGEFPKGELWKRDFTNDTFTLLTNGLPTVAEEPGAWSAPLVMDARDNSLLYHGRSKLYVTRNAGERWDVVSPDFPDLLGLITAIGLSNADSAAIYIGSDRGELWVSQDRGISWRDASIGLVNRFITDIAPSASDPLCAYVSVSGFGSDHVFKTIDAGVTWKICSAGLPDAPCNALAISPIDSQAVFAGTDIGVFASYDAGENWFPFGIGLPRSPVTDLAFHTDKGQLLAATHGRSIWRIVPPASVETFAVVRPAGGERAIRSRRLGIRWHGFSEPVRIEYAADGADWQDIADTATGGVMQWRVSSDPTATARIRISSNLNPEQIAVSDAFFVDTLRPGVILAESGVAHFPYGLGYDGKGGLWTTSFNDNRLYKLDAESFEVIKFTHISEGARYFTGLAYDRKRERLFVHRLSEPIGTGGVVLELDTNGIVQSQFPSPCREYPIGCALVNDTALALADRNTNEVFFVDARSGTPLTGAMNNPFVERFGPRGLCSDGSGFLYQASTSFIGSSLQAAYNLKFDTQNLAENARYELDTRSGSLSGFINARGIEFDDRDKTFWVSDTEGNIFKVAGFDISPLVSSAPRRVSPVPAFTLLPPAPNPFGGRTVVSFGLTRRADITVHLYNSWGQKALTAFNGTLPSGAQKVEIDGSLLPAGVYTVVFEIDGIFAGLQRAALLR